ncbi:MAG TPA: hypothetical protein VMO17_19890, partial [Terriglobia bacterium]|nr:hypothetical protein [Terriglobia bacterium]
MSELFSEGLPAGLVRFSVPDPTGRHLGIPRIAVLDPRRLEIFKPVDEQGEMLDLEFDLTNPKGVIGEWSDLTILPSGRGLPGIVLYGGGAFFREQATVVCYVAGRFQVVFQGHDVNFIDFDLDGYP